MVGPVRTTTLPDLEVTVRITTHILFPVMRLGVWELRDLFQLDAAATGIKITFFVQKKMTHLLEVVVLKQNFRYYVILLTLAPVRTMFVKLILTAYYIILIRLVL